VRINARQFFWWTCALSLLWSNITNSQTITPASSVNAHSFVSPQDVLNSDGPSDNDIFTLTTPLLGNSSATAEASASQRTEPPASPISAQSSASSSTQNTLQNPLHLSAFGTAVAQLTYETLGGWISANTDASTRIAADINLTAPGSINVTFGQSYSATEPPYSYPGAVFFLWNRDTNTTVYTEGWGPLYGTLALWAVGPFVYTWDDLPAGHYRVFAGSGGQTFNNNSVLSLHSNASTSFTFDLQVSSPPPAVSIHMMRGASPGAFENPDDGIDVPLTPKPDPGILALQPFIWGGMVTDGVTPLLFEFEQSTAAQASYTVTIDQALAAHLHILQGGSWGSGHTITFDGTTRTRFAYIDGLAPEAVIPTGETEAVAALTLTNTHDVVTKYFFVRRPPIFLVHGYNTNADTWSQAFVVALEAATPYDFISRLDYGVDGNFNTWGSFAELVPKLDQALFDEEGLLHQDWAFTRYDVVAHSQGGVLTRLLCGQSRTELTRAFKGPDNVNRGRFRRVITIGSPHNGSTFAYYVSHLNGVIPATLRFLGLLQPKFDPFGEQIAAINSAVLAPEANRFHLITATINGGDVTVDSPKVYSWVGLNETSTQPPFTRGEIVLQTGSDGVVDIQSERAGPGTPVSDIQGFNIAHLMLPGGAGIENDVFGAETSETTDGFSVGFKAATLLTGSRSDFGSFQNPTTLSAARKQQIIDEIPLSRRIDLINPGPFQRQAMPSGGMSYAFSFTPDPSEPLDGTANWHAEVFGPDGVTTAGITVTPDSSDSTHVTVDVDGLVRGDVVLYLSYSSTTGHLIFGTPVVVVSIPPGQNLTGIELRPNQIIASVGDAIDLEIWGRYDNGSTSQLFVQATNSSFLSSNVNVASVDSGTGRLRAAGPGEATVTATHAGFTGHTTVYVDLRPPVVATNPATYVASNSATLNGSVNPGGLPTTVHIQYGTTTSYGHTTTSQSYNGHGTQSVTANISGLSASTTYHFRIVATNSIGTSYGSDGTFTTLTATGSPVAATNPATLIASFSATLNGSVDPHGLTTTVHFQYGTTTSYGSTTSSQTKTGSTYQNVAANISGLTASTTYHFRIVATNSAGTRYGSDRTFTTLSATGPPVVITNSATLIASFSATLNGSVDPHGLTTTVYFQYGTTTGYGLTTAIQSKTGNAYQNVAANISGLTASTIYHFRIVATNSAGTVYGSDRTFTTLSATGPPVAITNPATNVASSSATLNGSVDPHGLTTTVSFQYGTTTSYGHTTATQSKTSNTYQNVSANISGLTASTTYHFRIVATNSGGTSHGGDRAFTSP